MGQARHAVVAQRAGASCAKISPNKKGAPARKSSTMRLMSASEGFTPCASTGGAALSLSRQAAASGQQLNWGGGFARAGTERACSKNSITSS